MTSFRALFRYFPPSCLYMLGMCVVWLGYKMGDWLVLSVFWVLCCRKKMSFMRCRSLHCTHKIWGKSRSRSLSSPPPNRDKDIAGKSPLQKERKKIERGGGRGGAYPMEWKHKCTRVHIYKLIESINIIVFGTKSKHQEELNSDIA